MDEAGAIHALEGALRPGWSATACCRSSDDIELPLAPLLARMERAGVSVDADLLRPGQPGAGRADRHAGSRDLRAGGRREVLRRLAPSSCRKSCSTSSNCPSARRPRPATPPARTCWKTWPPKAMRSPRKIIQWREVAKLKSTYADALPALINPETGKVHTSLNQTVASTGRLSSSNPNLQNIPVRTEIGREIRKAFVASPGHVLVSADYSQIELRLFAHITKDPGLVDAFTSDAGHPRADRPAHL